MSRLIYIFGFLNISVTSVLLLIVEICIDIKYICNLFVWLHDVYVVTYRKFIKYIISMSVFMAQRISPCVNYERTRKHTALISRICVRKTRLDEFDIKKHDFLLLFSLLR